MSALSRTSEYLYGSVSYATKMQLPRSITDNGGGVVGACECWKRAGSK